VPVARACDNFKIEAVLRRIPRTILKESSQIMDKKFRVFATCDIGEAIDLLRKRGYEVESILILKRRLRASLSKR
jgi:hypothetical protein